MRPKMMESAARNALIYKKNLSPLEAVQRDPDTKLAVVVHLYYIESWDDIALSLRLLQGEAFDLFITLPEQNRYFTITIKKNYPNAHIINVPNQGRDVLPFIKVAAKLKDIGYVYLLKVHSKKSTHRTDGQDWLKDMLDCLVPENKNVLSDLLQILEQKETGIVGPKGQYVPLTVNFEANGTHMTRVITNLYSKQKSFDVLQTERAEYGFFGGTMFWARLDAISTLINFGTNRFESEQGQIDGTFAHALERLFCIVPEIEKKTMYQISPISIKTIPYKTHNVPDWSDVYIGPQNSSEKDLQKL